MNRDLAVRTKFRDEVNVNGGRESYVSVRRSLNREKYSRFKKKILERTYGADKVFLHFKQDALFEDISCAVALIEIYKDLRKRDVNLTIFAESPSAEYVLSSTKLDGIMRTFYPNEYYEFPNSAEVVQGLRKAI